LKAFSLIHSPIEYAVLVVTFIALQTAVVLCTGCPQIILQRAKIRHFAGFSHIFMIISATSNLLTLFIIRKRCIFIISTPKFIPIFDITP